MMHSESFLQSTAWEKFNQAMGHKTWRVYGILVIKIVARRGTFLLVPHATSFSKEIIALGNNEGCDFIRVCPLVEDLPENRLKFQDLKFKNAPAQMHPIMSWVLDITQPEEQILSDMRKTTRYSIRKAEKDGVIIIQENNLENFWEIYSATVDRQNFTPFSRTYLENEIKTMQTKMFFAVVNGKRVASAIVVFDGDGVYYHHGASLAEHPTASYLMQWQIILEAKKRGCLFYNFWGVVEDDQKKHPWYGLSQFKKGFGGSARRYVPAQDLVLKNKYWLSYFIEKIRKYKRGL